MQRGGYSIRLFTGGVLISADNQAVLEPEGHMATDLGKANTRYES